MKLTIISLLLLFVLVTLFGVVNIYGQGQEEEKINQNSLVACVDHFMNIYNNSFNSMTEEQKQNITDNIFANPQSMKMVTIKACMFSYEHTGKYLNLLPIEETSKYAELAAQTIFLEGLRTLTK